MPIPTRMLTAGIVLLVSCGGDSTPTAPDNSGSSPTYTYSLSAISGDGQLTRVGSAPVAPIRVRLLRSDNTPVAGASLTSQVTSGGGQVQAGSTVTDANGHATISGWTMGAAPGQNTLSVSSSAHAASVALSAIARWPFWTVMVFLAADNNLSIEGLKDLEEIEAAGADPEVQVVIQGEFSPSYMGLAGLSPADVNLSSWSTFRYVLGPAPARWGPDGTVTDLGPTDMTAPTTLSEFVQWARAEYPSEREILIPWNHGGGYAGLIQDLTQRGSYLMTLEEFRSALISQEPLDIIDFDMCLMGGYETLLSVSGLTDLAIFSEELVPGEGNPYDDILSALQANPEASTRDVAGIFIDGYTDAYLGGRSSTTKSAYDLDGLDALDEAITLMAATLAPRLTALRTDLVAILGESQKFAYRELTDIVDFAERLASSATDPDVVSAASNVVGAASSPEFRIAHRSYSATDDANVDDATGLHFVFPSGVGEDAFDASGRRSLGEYTTAYPNSPWGVFLADWASALSTTPTTDLGAGRGLEMYEVWDQGTVDAGADVDFWLWEPTLRLFVPWQGTLTTNGLFSGDSYDADPHGYYEGWLSRQVIQQGEYKFYAHLWTAPASHQTALDIAYRFESTEDFTYVYDPTPVILSYDQLLEDDATPTLAEAEAGDYGNFKWVAVWDVGPIGPLQVSQRAMTVSAPVVDYDLRGSAVLRARSREQAPGPLRQAERNTAASRLQPPATPRRR